MSPPLGLRSFAKKSRISKKLFVSFNSVKFSIVNSVKKPPSQYEGGFLFLVSYFFLIIDVTIDITIDVGHQ